jgi:hypothetical protein
MVGFKDFKRKTKTNEYYLGDIKMFELSPHPEYKKMFYVKYENGSLSEDFYNRTRAAAFGRHQMSVLINMMEEHAETARNKGDA